MPPRMPTRGSPENDYERARALRIEANRRIMEELGLRAAAEALQQVAQPSRPKAAPQPKRPRQQYEIEVEVRRSGRLRGSQPATYAEDQMFQQVGIDRVDLLDAPRRRRVNVDPARLAALREGRAREAGDEAPRGPFDSGRGVRIQGGRVYDSLYGVTCHWCRQKTLEDHVTCTNAECGGGRKLPVSFCKMCLRNRHGEDIAQAEASGCWVCPPCRGSCGEGCTLCCNCGPCRKKAGLAPTHQVIKEARAAGFGNAHDYLVGQRTGLAPGDVAARKEAHAWAAWLKVPYEPAASEDEEQQQQQVEEQQQQQVEPERAQPATSPAAQPAAAAAAVELEEAGVVLEGEAPIGGSNQVARQGRSSRPGAPAPRRSARAAAAAAAAAAGGSGKVSAFFSAAKENEESAAVQAATTKATEDGKMLTRKERMKRKLGLVSRPH